MTPLHNTKPLIRTLAEAIGVGIACAAFTIVWMLVTRRNLGLDDYKLLLPTFFGAGAIIYASGELIAGGRIGGAFLGSILGLLLFGWLAQLIVDGDHVIVRLIAPGIGFLCGAVLGATGQQLIRSRST